MCGVRPPSSPPPPPPFDAQAARRLRGALGMGPEHVAHALRSAYGLPYVTPGHVLAWERGTVGPDHTELAALAGALWCDPGELLDRPRTLREHRIARGVAPQDVAHAVGVGLPAYLGMEEDGVWRGTGRQLLDLVRVLRLEPPDVVAVTGRTEPLAALLRGAVTTRWQAYVRQVGELVALERPVLEEGLRRLHRDYQGRMTATLGWGGGGTAGAAGEEFLERIVENFWAAVQREP
ncbi:helix-turn-helix domain-containing protein [Streptomyces sp. NPDC094021]|uniref:helix-turn-helix domain-containing protein n=1 Tax=Streptomyces sp. NPDC094021 TaxID=3366054 RepID=UPI0038076AD1